MSLKALDHKRTVNYVIMLILLIIFTTSLYSINFIYPKDPVKKQEIERSPTMMKLRKIGRFVIPFITLLSFFSACVVVAYIIADGGNDLLKVPRDQYAGIYFLLIAGIILTVMNFTVLKERSIKEYIKGKKFSVIGAFMALGVSAIVFGFLDNFGMKLGTEALDDTFVQLFLGPFSSHRKFEDYKDNIAENLQIINNWSNGSWRTVMNHLLRCKDDIGKLAKSSKLSDNRLNDLMDDLNSFVQEGGKPLNIPRELVNQRVNVLRAELLSISKSFNNVITIDPNEYFCSQQFCSPLDEADELLFSDGDHFSLRANNLIFTEVQKSMEALH